MTFCKFMFSTRSCVCSHCNVAWKGHKAFPCQYPPLEQCMPLLLLHNNQTVKLKCCADLQMPRAEKSNGPTCAAHRKGLKCWWKWQDSTKRNWSLCTEISRTWGACAFRLALTKSVEWNYIVIVFRADKRIDLVPPLFCVCKGFFTNVLFLPLCTKGDLEFKTKQQLKQFWSPLYLMFFPETKKNYFESKFYRAVRSDVKPVSSM